MTCNCLEKYEVFFKNKYTIKEVSRIIANDLYANLKPIQEVNEVQRIDFLRNILKYNWPQVAEVVNKEFSQSRTYDSWRHWYNRRK